MELSEFTAALNDLLDTQSFTEIDASPNGLQVGHPDGRSITHAAFAVDGVEATIEAAMRHNADILCVHHGIIWGGIERLTGVEYNRISALIQGNLPLYVSHLPLDSHPKYGNAAQLGSFLGSTDQVPFGKYGDQHIGQLITLPEPVDSTEIQMQLAELETGDRPVQTFAFGASEIRDIAIVTGAGADWLREASDRGADALITGEGKQQLYHEARELDLTVFLAGHYATETFGVQSIADVVESWGIETTFISHPTSL